MSAPTDSHAPRSAPSRFRRWRMRLLIVAGLGFVFLGLLALPVIQGWLVRRAVALQPDWRVNFAHFGATPGALAVDGLEFTMPGLEAKGAPIGLEFSPWDLAARQLLHIERVHAKKLRVTLHPDRLAGATQPSPATPTAPAKPFAGLLPLLNPALPWSLDRAEIDAEVTILEGDRPLLTGTLSVHGGAVAAGRTGEFTYDLALRSALLPTDPARPVRASGKLLLTQDAEHRVTRVELNGDLHLPALGALMLPPAKFSLTVEPAPTGEAYRASLEFNSATKFEATATLDAAHSTLAGHATLAADQSLAASLRPGGLPSVTASGRADFSLDLRTLDLDATLGGDLDAGNWTALLPQLSTVDALKARLDATVSRRAGKISVSRLESSLRGATAPAALTFALTEPVDPLALPERPVARLALDGWPADWVNPFLASLHTKLAPAALSAEWSLTPLPGHALRLTPVRPVTLGPLALAESPLPALPAVSFSLSPLVEASRRQVTLKIEDFAATAGTGGDKISGRLNATLNLADGNLTSSGALHGSLPTLLAAGGQPAPFTLNTHWNFTKEGRVLRVDRLGFSAKRDEKRETPAYISLRLLQPIPLDLANPGRALAGPTPEWVRLRFQKFPLNWASRWLRGFTLGGELVEGESVLRSGADGRFTLDTAVPWRVADVSLSLGGRRLFEVGAQVSPALDFVGGRGSLRLDRIIAENRSGERVTGRIEFNASAADRKGSTLLAFDADLPSLPHSAGTFGALTASLRARLHNDTDRLAVMDEFALRISRPAGELLSIESPEPFLFGLSHEGFFTTGMIAPLTLKFDAFPLEWLRPWTGSLQLGGTLQPCEMFVLAAGTKYRFRAMQPVHVKDFSATLGGRELARDTGFSFYPGLDLNFLCQPLPKFVLGFEAMAHVSDGVIDVGGRRAMDLDLAVSALGDATRVLPNSLELISRVDFTPLHSIAELAARGLPRAGTLVTRVNGGLREDDPVEVWGRLEGVPAATGKSTVPALEFSAHGKLTGGATVTADVAVTLATAPRPSDLRFEAVLNLNKDRLEIASGLRSTFLDAAGLLALGAAFQPPAPAAPPAPAPTAEKPAATPPPAYARLDHPFWGNVRGSFDLDLATLQYAPYRIDRVRGRLDVRDRELDLSDLSGEMFAGRWSGRLKATFLPDEPGPNHTLDGEFNITQFDTARVVQSVFPTELASVEARLNVRTTVRSRGGVPLELIDRAEVDFTADGGPGILRLRAPKQDTLSTAAVFGGTLLLSPELRALGRLLKKFSEMPVDTLRLSGQRAATGEVTLGELRVESPQARITATGGIGGGTAPLMERPLHLSIQLAAKDDTAVILGGMSLLRWRADPDGYKPMKEPFIITGKAGQPDTQPLYDLLAQAVTGSKGTWGFLMRKVQDEVNKKKTPPPKSAAAPRTST